MSTQASELVLGVVQCPLSGSLNENLSQLSHWIRDAASRGAGVVLTPELPQGPYFPQQQQEELFSRARTLDEDETVTAMRELATRLQVVLPVSFFERDGPSHYNGVAVIDADGTILGVYRKSHIPDGPGYQEKFYFRPGDTGFRVWQTRRGRIGVGVCWDQWFPECARVMTLLGADALLYPTAIGSEPEAPELDTQKPWQRVMVGHAVANAIPVAAANRVGFEPTHDAVHPRDAVPTHDARPGITFYGSSFIADFQGELVQHLGRTESGVRIQRFDLSAIRRYRASFGFFRDRRPDLYARLCD